MFGKDRRMGVQGRVWLGVSKAKAAQTSSTGSGNTSQVQWGTSNSTNIEINQLPLIRPFVKTNFEYEGNKKTPSIAGVLVKSWSIS